MSKKIISIMLALSLAFAMLASGLVSASAADIEHVLHNSSSGYELTSGTYYVNDNVTITNNTDNYKGSAIKIAEGAEVTLDISAGCTLTVIGKKGSGRTGGGAGIWLPEDTYLDLVGGGKIVATGGNAGNGANGTKGGDIDNLIEFLWKWLKDYFTSRDDVVILSAGGKGGAGGGGAGAGIGTPGADAGDGGAPGYVAKSKSGRTVVDYANDPSGHNGDSTQKAQAMGVLTNTDVAVEAVGGAGGNGGKGAGLTKGIFGAILSGAGGAGGGGGYAAAKIGKGGDSGAGGGGGATPYYKEGKYPSLDEAAILAIYNTAKTEGGFGGNGAVNGTDGKGYTPESYSTSYTGGASGTAGSVGSNQVFDISYEYEGTISSKNPKSYTYPSTVALPTVANAGATFEGWTTDEDANGTPITKLSATDAGDKVFYAKFADEEATYYGIDVSVNNPLAGTVSVTVGGKAATVAKAGDIVTLTPAANAGYSFDSYATSDVTIPENSFEMPESNVAITVNFASNSYNVAFNKNGGVGGTEYANAYYGEAMPEITFPEKTHSDEFGDYTDTFLGYYDGEGVAYYNAAGQSAKNFDLLTNLSLTADWQLDPAVKSDAVDAIEAAAVATRIDNSAMNNAKAAAILGVQNADDDYDTVVAARTAGLALIETTRVEETVTGFVLVKAPTIGGGRDGLYNLRTYYVADNGSKVTLDSPILKNDLSVDFEGWYLRVIYQKKIDGSGADIRLISMVDSGFENYREAGFICTINGKTYNLKTTEVYSSFLANGIVENIADYSSDVDRFFMVKCGISANTGTESITVQAYLVLNDGTELTGKQTEITVK